MKKILLTLTPNHDLEISDLARAIIGPKAFYGSDYVRSSIQVSFNRALLKLESLGLVNVNRQKNPNERKGYTYFLSGTGNDLAKIIRKQIKEFILEWQNFGELEKGEG